MSARQERRKNRVVWFEIPANDLARATKFYETILATSLKAETFGAHELRVFAHDDDAASGCLMKGPGFEPSKVGEARTDFRNFRLDRMARVALSDRRFVEETGKGLNDFLKKMRAAP